MAVQRVSKRFDRERDALLTFVDKEGIEPTNNRAAVIISKISQGSKSDEEARMMSIIRTLNKRGYDPLETITDALKTKVKTGVLPASPKRRNLASQGAEELRRSNHG